MQRTAKEFAHSYMPRLPSPWGNTALTATLRTRGSSSLTHPLVTYRPPDQAQAKDLTADEARDDGVVAAFYKDIQRNFGGQVIVMEAYSAEAS